MRTLSKQVAIISGGLGDIGRAVAIELARRGADIAVSDIRPDADAASLLSELFAVGVKARYDRVDVTSAADVAAWVERIEKEMGVPTLSIVNAAGVMLAGVLDVTAEQWSRELDVNLNGAFHMAQSAAKRLVAANMPGRIVFIGSWAAHAAHTYIPAYCVAKAGLRMLVKCMALELAPKQILVNEVAPGYVDAGLTASVFAKTPGARERAAERVPTGQLISASEVALQVAWLCEPENRHMTGSVVLMDGGLSLVTPAKR